MRELKIQPIRNGTVIDHIPNGRALDVLRILGLRALGSDSTVSVAIRVRSDKLGYKDIVKVENMALTARHLDALCLIAPSATISIIRDFKVRDKRVVDLPTAVTGILTCPNPSCISNVGEPIESEFEVARRRPVTLRCVYCERQVVDFLHHLRG